MDNPRRRDAGPGRRDVLVSVHPSLKSGRIGPMFAAMQPAALDLAQRTSLTAGPFATHLAADCRGIAASLRGGDLEIGLSRLEATTDRLGRFLTFVVVSSDLLRHQAPQIGGFLTEYGRRLLGALDDTQRALDSGDPTDLCVALERRLGQALADYDGYAGHVSAALGSRLAA